MAGRRNIVVADVGGTKVASAIVSVGERDVPPEVTPLGKVASNAALGGAHVLATIQGQVREAIASAGRMGMEVTGVGISSAGVIDPDTGDVTYANDLMPGWGGIRLASEVSSACGLPVRALNDVHAHALGEARWGAGRGARDVLVAGIGTGVGGAFVHAGAILRGAHDKAGHIGHVPVAAAAGIRCACGCEGHVEPVASGTGIVDRYIALGGEKTYREAAGAPEVPMDGAEVNRRAVEEHDEAAIEAQRFAGRALGEALGGMANMLDPDSIVLTGSVIKCGRHWHDAVAEGFSAMAMPPLRETPIRLALLGDDSALVGAAEHFLRSGYLMLG